MLKIGNILLTKLRVKQMRDRTYAIILASGKGERINKYNIPKQFLEIKGKSIIEYTIERFEECKLVDNIIIVIHPKYIDFMHEVISLRNYNKIYKIITGGITRRESSFKGVNIIKESDSKVLIHDAVRPFITKQLIERCIIALDNYKAVYPAVPSEDTIIEKNNSLVKSIPIRLNMLRGQTPQGFKSHIIKKAHECALYDPNVDLEVTNDCGLVARYHLSDILIIEGERYNFKITYDEDYFFAEAYINHWLCNSG
jgi:ribitol-5-phosphate 2-dehydrogenase (NADP+) / D-ribitol-5-phosphate cytidylyltransferase